MLDGARSLDQSAAAAEAARLGLRAPASWSRNDSASAIDVYAAHWDVFLVCNSAKPSFSTGPMRAVCTGFAADELRLAVDVHGLVWTPALLGTIRQLESAFLAAQRGDA